VRKTLSAYRQSSFDQPGRLLVSHREHEQVVKAVCAGDDAAAAEAMRQHIGAGGEAMMALVRAAEALA
jgi:DNA-binding GntR family transcriptional regulator